jgi:hypothetical protein
VLDEHGFDEDQRICEKILLKVLEDIPAVFKGRDPHCIRIESFENGSHFAVMLMDFAATVAAAAQQSSRNQRGR